MKREGIFYVLLYIYFYFHFGVLNAHLKLEKVTQKKKNTFRDNIIK